ncbi:MAG: FAD-binding protein [Planctomycetes bacterium]|nr:FAD-binding protein [Planctomycetota bacterium]MCL4730381.1 FAD-binding protein [Planctomycetota bacterium]
MSPAAYSAKRFDVDYARLRRQLKGAVRDDPLSRALYASSASVVEVWPSCVVEPVDAGDVEKTLAFAREHRVPVTCRGAGSGVAGQSLGPGIILDFSVHQAKILEVHPVGQFARVQPGVVKDDFDAELGAFGMFWPPDPSSSPWCTVGAMVSNNSGGAKSIRWGTAKDYLQELDVLLISGERCKLRPLDVSAEGKIAFPADATAAEIRLAEGALRIAREHAKLIAQQRPEATRSSSGYNLFELLHQPITADVQAFYPRVEFDPKVGNGKPGILDMPRLFSGSEGTLGVLLEARLRVLKLPKAQAGVSLYFDSNEKMAEGVVKLLPTRPTKLEVLDRSFIDVAAKSDPKLGEGIPARLQSLLIVEYWADTPEQARQGVQAAMDACAKGGPAFEGRPALDAKELDRAWTVRKVASPILSRVKGDLKPTRWIEDCAVPPWKLPEFISRFKAICEKHGFAAALFGHGGEGNLHVNPFANAKDAGHRERMRQAASEVFAMVKSLKGTISGEHGDGIMRSPYLKQMYGDIYPLFVQVKDLFDSGRLLNPLSKVGPEAQSPESGPGRSITSFLRVGEDYTRVQTGTALDSPAVAEEIEKCHGCGKCRHYCPLMKVGKDEKFSARAKANLLRGVISGRLDASYLLDAEFKANLDLCIACEQCLVECPTQVDIPGIAIAFREQYVDRKGKGGLFNDMLSRPDQMGKVGTKLAGVTNVLLKNRFLRGVAQAATGLDERRKLPAYRKAAGIAKLKPLNVPAQVRARLPAEVVVFPGCFAEYYDPDGEKATLVAILDALSITVHTPELNCCGISKITQGDRAGARQDIAQNIEKLIKPVRRGAKILFSAPSCLLAAKREWEHTVGPGEANLVAAACVDAHALFAETFRDPDMLAQLRPNTKKIAWHSPCHSRVLGVADAARALLDLIDQKRTMDLNAGCCGLSGSFGLKTDNFDMSMKIGQGLFNRINREQPDVVTTSCGICQTQVRQGVPTREDGGKGPEVLHPLRLLYEALR